MYVSCWLGMRTWQCSDQTPNLQIYTATCNCLPRNQNINQDNSTRHFCHDLELRGGDLISSPVDSIASLVSPKKSYGPNSVGKNYFSATPFFTFSKNATGDHNA